LSSDILRRADVDHTRRRPRHAVLVPPHHRLGQRPPRPDGRGARAQVDIAGTGVDDDTGPRRDPGATGLAGIVTEIAREVTAIAIDIDIALLGRDLLVEDQIILNRDAALGINARLLLDSRVVDVTRSCNPIFITISSLKPFLFNDLINEWRYVGRMEA
jgi:hypothetical protein